MIEPGTRWTLVFLGLAIAALMNSGCQAPAPDVERIADAIQNSDSLARVRPRNKRLGPEDFPIEAQADSDSVAWLNIIQERVLPEGHVATY